MDSGHTSAPLPSFKSLRCFRWGVKDLGPESDCFRLSSDDTDMAGEGTYDERGRRKGFGAAYIGAAFGLLRLVPVLFCHSKKGTGTR
jgi:hypothetical protein